MTVPIESTYAFKKSAGFNNYLRKNRTIENCCAFMEAEIKQSYSILDIGCGPGTITSGFAKMAPHAAVTGIDIHDSQIQLAKKYAQAESYQNLAFQQGSIFELPFPDNSFDLVFVQTVFVHIPDHPKALAEIKRVLKPNGIFANREIINSYVIITPYSQLLEKTKTIFHNGIIAMGGRPDAGLFMGESIMEAGFRDLKQSMKWERSPEGDTEHFLNITSPILHGELGLQAIRNGWITEEEIRELEVLCTELPTLPNAMWGVPFVESIAINTNYSN